MKTTAQISAQIATMRPRGAWGKAVQTYALELLEDLPQDQPPTAAALLNGADDWRHFSWGGSALIYDEDIARRVCCPSEIRRTKAGQLPPNKSEQWLDTQARALGQAAALILRA